MFLREFLTQCAMVKERRKPSMDDLNRRGWLVETFKRHLEADPWPDKDKAVDQRSNRKSNAEADGPPVAKRMRSSEVDG